MIKSVTYLGEDKKSYELSEESDIQTLDTSVAEGSVARVTGKVTAEYELREGNWVKTAGGSGEGGGNVFIVSLNSSNVADKTFAEISAAIEANSMVFLKYTDKGDTYFPLVSYVKGNEIDFMFTTIGKDAGKDAVVSIIFTCGSTDEWNQIRKTYPSGN